MPKILFEKPDVANMASKLPRPLQYPVGAALGGLASVLGSDNPESIMPGPSGMEAAPLITIYKDAMGVPSKMLRQAATQEFVNSARALDEPYIENAALEFAHRYPRVAAHMRMQPNMDMTNEYSAITHVPGYEVTAPLKVAYSNRGLARDANSQADALNTMFHEGTHVAQALGNKWTDILYKMGLKLPGGYEQHPLERTARMSASLASGLLDERASPEPALRGLRKAAEAALQNPELERTGDAVRAAKTILDLINARVPK
jgi:hypothetical protein